MEMTLGTVCRTSSLKLKHGGVNVEEELGLRFVRYTRGLGRKRIGISNEMEESLPLSSTIEVPLLKRQCSERTIMMKMMIDDYHEKSSLESLPQDVLVSTKNPKASFLLVSIFGL